MKGLSLTAAEEVPALEDRQIIALYWAREESALRETERKYGPYCRAVAANILCSPEDAEECVSDAWLNAWNSIPPQRPDSLRAYLGRLVRNAALSLYRRGRAEKRGGGLEVLLSELGDCAATAPTPEEAFDARRLGEVLSRWLRGLDPARRRLFLRRYWLGESVQALAREAGCAGNTLAVRLRRLRLELKTYLEQEGYPL